MRQKFKPWAKQYLIDNEEFFIEYEKDKKYDWAKIFRKVNPIDIEIGMGKGSFIIEMARKNPNINYLGIEMHPSVQVSALQEIENTKIHNIKLISMNAKNLESIFDKNEIKNIYLNFSDPWPKARHEKRRLTFKKFLNIYTNLSNKGNLIFKTDNLEFFNWSVKHIKEYGLKVKWLTRDLWNEDVENIRTEYENKFGNKGFKINKLIAKLDK